ncbi:MAG: ATP-dependent DNA helicase RecG, partial [candidate division WOR-3 bacterium]
YIKAGEDVVVRGRVIKKFKRHRENNISEAVIVISDGSGIVELIWRGMEFILGKYEIGDIILAAGRAYSGRSFGSFRIFHPEIATEDELVGITPVYPQTEGLKSKTIHKLVEIALKEVEIPETLPEYIVKSRNLVSLKDALYHLHFPNSEEEILQGKKRVIYEQFLKFYLSLNISASFGKRRAIPLNRTGKYTDEFVKSLPFKLTEEQMRVMGEIEEDMSKDEAMHRLLQGDVGSGKTVVLLWSALIAIENGYQAALMAPTEILAEQIFSVAYGYLKPLGINVVLLTSSQKGRVKRLVREEVRSGRAQLVIGTHALITDETVFKNLALAIVDEQHRFGVAQRARLVEKAKDYYPHFLVSTATPIPRTLALTVYGDLKVSRITKRPFETVVYNRVVRKGQRLNLYKWLFRKIIETKRQAYVIAPLIDESEKMQLISVQKLYENLISIAPPEINVGLIHGKMKLDERNGVMERFRSGEIHILVSTTIVEVGVDVPKAKFMVVEDAHRFGIAQLHQLRGRILRNEEPAFFIMVVPEKLGYEAYLRIKAIESITDGFVLAEEDMKIRGPGEIIGTKQHGEWSLKGINLTEISSDERFLKIVEIAKKDAEYILTKDPDLLSEKNKILRETLQNFKDAITVG